MSKHATLVIIILCLLLTFAGCTSDPVSRAGGAQPVITNCIITPQTSFTAGETATVTVNWTAGIEPFTIAIDTDTGASLPAGTPAGLGQFTWDFTLVEGGPYTCTVSVTGPNNARPATETYVYGPVEPEPNDPPVIESVNATGSVVTVTVSDPEGDDVTVSVSEITGFIPDTYTQVVTGGNGDAVFIFWVNDFVSGAEGNTTISAWDAHHVDQPATTDVYVEVVPVTDPLPEGQIVAHAMSATAAVGETVTIRVLCSDFPAGAAFNYMNSVAITFEDGGNYVHDAFNIGSIGGEEYDIDGIWATMSPAPTSFFVFEDLMMVPTDVTANSSLDFMQFNITPIGAGEVTGGGDLFNFGMSFDHAGVYHLGFLEFQDVKRTYYSDNAAVEHNWLDLNNVLENLQNTITVTE